MTEGIWISKNQPGNAVITNNPKISVVYDKKGLFFAYTDHWGLAGKAHSSTQIKSAAVSSTVADGKGKREITHWLLKLPHGRDMITFHWPEQITWPHLIQRE